MHTSYVEISARNLTLHLPVDLIEKAKAYAAQHDISLNRLVKEFLEQAILDDDRTRLAGNSISADLAHPPEYRISFWDALILAAAQSSGAQILYTEDLNDGQQYGNLRVENPFREIKARRS